MQFGSNRSQHSKLPDNRENTGNFAEFGLISRKLAR
jgi:hypothetical protein